MKDILLTKSFMLPRLLDRCHGKQDRECLFRLFKEAAIMDQDFEAAMALRALQQANMPCRRMKGGRS